MIDSFSKFAAIRLLKTKTRKCKLNSQINKMSYKIIDQKKEFFHLECKKTKKIMTGVHKSRIVLLK